MYPQTISPFSILSYYKSRRAVPKPPKSNSGTQKPKLTEFDYEAIGEKIGEALEFQTEVTITIYFEEKLESVTGIIKSADSQIGQLTLESNPFNSVKINIMSIVSVE